MLDSRARSIALTTLIALGGPSTLAQPAPAQVPAELQLMRAINTAQADLRRQGAYSELAALLLHRVMAPLADEIAPAGDGSGQFRAHRLTVVLSADGQRYKASIVPDDRCGNAWFSDERGLIYRGQVIGCRR